MMSERNSIIRNECCDLKLIAEDLQIVRQPTLTTMPNRRNQLEIFARAGLKWNPFRIPAPFEQQDVYVETLRSSTNLTKEIVHSAASVTQIIARAGHGKSSLLSAILRDLQSHDIANRFAYIPPELLAKLALPSADIEFLIVDEAERLTGANLRRLASWATNGKRLVFSTHHDLQRHVPKSTVKTIELAPLSPFEVTLFFDARCQWASAGAQLELENSGAEWLVRHCDGNIRVIEAVLYELFQGRLYKTPETKLNWSIDAADLSWLEVFADRRTAHEAIGNVPFSRTRLIRNRFLTAAASVRGFFSTAPR